MLHRHSPIRIIRITCTMMLVLGLSTLAIAPPSRAESVDRQHACQRLDPAQTPPRVGIDPPRPVDVTAPGTVVSPTVIELRQAARPGDRFVCTIIIRNRRGVSSVYELVPLGALAAPAAAHRSVDFVEENDPRADETAVSWVEPVRASVQLAPDATARVPVVVTVPEDAPDGGGYAAIAVRVKTAASATANIGVRSASATAPNVGIISEVAVPLLIPVGTHPRVAMRLSDLTAPRLRVDRAHWRLSARITNTGNVHVRPRGTVTISSIFGNRIARLPIAASPLLPHGTTQAAVEWTGVPWLGVYRVQLRLGAAAGQRTTITRDRWLVTLPPWWLIGVITALVVAVVALAHWRRGSGLDDDDDGDGDDYFEGDGDGDFDTTFS